jgi:GntR family phosphonate transport system transcriptional regulator
MRSAPVYRQVSDQLRADITAFAKPGERLPNERDLAARFGVNRHTLRRAIDELVDCGLVERRHGSGTFVCAHLVLYPLTARTRFTETLAEAGRQPASEVLRSQPVRATGGVAARLALQEGAPILWIETRRLVDGEPFCLISHFIAEPWASLAADYAGGSLHQHLIARSAGLRLLRTTTLVSARLPVGDDARLLAMPRNVPVVRTKTVNACAGSGRPVEYALTRFRGDRAELRIDFSPNHQE